VESQPTAQQPQANIGSAALEPDAA
jgi:hypothetical protein